MIFISIQINFDVIVYYTFLIIKIFYDNNKNFSNNLFRYLNYLMLLFLFNLELKI